METEIVLTEREKRYSVLTDYALTKGYDPKKTILPVGMWCTEHSLHRIKRDPLLRSLYFEWSLCP